MSQENSLNNTPLIVVTGPTASGKTSLATQLAYQIEGEVISADSRQVFRQMDIGTGKDLKDFVVEGTSIPYHLIDICDPGDDFNLYLFQKLYTEAVHDIINRKKNPILCGGTGLYIEAVTLEGYEDVWVPKNFQLRDKFEDSTLEEMLEYYKSLLDDDQLKDVDGIAHRQRSLMRAIEIEYFNKYNVETDIHPVNIPQLETYNFALNIDRDTRWSKIEKRLDERLKEGMIEEVDSLLQQLDAEKLKSYGLEYRFVTSYLLNEISYDDMRNELLKSIQQFSKRQMTWFRRMEKKTKLHWIPVEWETNKKIDFVLNTINSNQ
ncbi:tRNA (adenosine(37)-N6)-dimethylallyltransferase MiaA [Flammeovirga yaeyamensis]|uniref:tRNA dimethylallyltransferase n=1 Tax=Flammeovirga yaeyamensis TaxID=367791 RepID=A0AAX1MYK6_9BACT|nr:tRNA (adenosine(37)-N6)-dimethylallyltransferase MiaA [Flammeovirga yaeyamensis]MBB3696278.1 tRNA dimethylallyltransferase [Flammeovirga yaeyamensis]NMF34959.1 tRNA (adenosine(37)-N6)-dimethylallyltransferase MiaA [Flammeovirga yaeyamensis]QWG00216.1 tRNA (adenosine(37)-N6)-dimethylallyltransferase MiaA [Flammeovirga yaeyamensis]